MSFTSQKYKKYFTLNHNGPKNVRTVQTIASIGVEMMPAGADVGCGWVYINKVGLRCKNVFSRRAACWGEDATKCLVPFQESALCGGAWGVDVAESTLSDICRHQASRQAAMDDAFGYSQHLQRSRIRGVCTLGRGAAHLNPKLQLDELQKNT